jgi:RNA polymerase sigma factor (sigma-70 family)
MLLRYTPPMLSRLSDEDLMRQYGNGDLDAFTELYQRHSRGLYRFIAWRSPRSEWVDEVMQDSWASLHQARDRYEALASFKTYLYQIARNRLIDLVRQQQLVTASDLGQGENSDAVFDHLAAESQESQSPEDALEAKQKVAGLHEAIRALPSDQREALILQQFNGMSLDEISQLVSVPVETVKSRLRYAMKKLRQHLVENLAAQEEQA